MDSSTGIRQLVIMAPPSFCGSGVNSQNKIKFKSQTEAPLGVEKGKAENYRSPYEWSLVLDVCSVTPPKKTLTLGRE